MFERNVGGLDRTLRAVGAVLALVVAALAWQFDADSASLVAVLVAAGLGFNALTGFCWGNKLFGIDTCTPGESSTED
jgi:hypothetical protein